MKVMGSGQLDQWSMIGSFTGIEANQAVMEALAARLFWQVS
jgi:hypothetical protein